MISKTSATWFLGLAVLWFMPGCTSATVLLVNVNSSSVAGVTGNLEFQFVPGVPAPLPATATISNFQGGTIDGAPATFGPVTGSLSDSLTFTNSALGDYFQPFTYGNSLSFMLVITGMSSPALGASTFAFSMFNNSTPLVPLLTANLTDGFAFEVTDSKVTNFSAQTTIIEPVPEPASSGLIILGIMGLLRFFITAHKSQKLR